MRKPGLSLCFLILTSLLLFTPEFIHAQNRLTADDVRRVISQSVVQAQALGLRAHIAVVDQEGRLIGSFRMTGAPDTTRVVVDQGINGLRCPGADGLPAAFAAISKAVTGSFLSSQGHAFTSRTASFIVQKHFPPGITFTAGGPLFGVQFSQLPCSDINPKAPLGLSADPGGLPLYKNGILAGGIGIEGDGIYTLDPDPRDRDLPAEEITAVAATRGFETPAAIRAEQIIVNGIRFPYANATMPAAIPLPAFGDLPGTVTAEIINAPAPEFRSVTLNEFPGRVESRFFPFKAGSLLTLADVQQIITQAAAQARITRGAIRQPLGSSAEVNIAVVDTNGVVLGIFSTPDAALFGFDVAVQKARSVAFLTSSTAAARLIQAESGKFTNYVEAASNDGLRLDGSVAFSDRALGFLHRPFFPDGIEDTRNGPFSKPDSEWNIFNVGLQLDLIGTSVCTLLGGGSVSSCTAVPGLENGLQIFPGAVPLYKNGQLAGAIGISGDGVDQDDIIAAFGSAGFEAPKEMRSDRVFVRGVRLPFVKFPRHPNL